jgi:hypothetical protein
MTFRLLGLPEELRLEIEQNSPGVTTQAAQLITDYAVQQAQMAAEEITAQAVREIQSIIGPHGTISRLQAGGVVIAPGLGIGVYEDGILKTSILADGNLSVGSNIDNPATTTFNAFVNNQVYNNQEIGEGDLLIGDNSSDAANVFYDASEGQLQFRLGTTITAYMDTDGTLKFLAGEIGGWVIGADSLTDTAGTVGLSSAVTVDDDLRLWAGNADPDLAPFKVYESGALYALDATIQGNINATSGGIGGWTVDANRLWSFTADNGIELNAANQVIKIGNVLGVGGINIQIDGQNERIRSSNFVTGQTGFNIAANTGDAEFNNITARGELKTFLLTSSNQMAVAGNIIVSKDAGKLGAAVSSGATTVDFGKALTVGNWIKIQGPDTAGAASLEWMLIGSLVSGTTYNVTRNVDGSGANAWAKDTPFVVIGASGDSRIELVAGSSGSIQLITQGATWNTQTVQAEMSTTAGAIRAGAGTVLMDSTGIKIIATGLLAANNGYKFVDTADTTKLLGGLYAIARHSPNFDAYVELRANPQDGTLATVYASVDSVASTTAIARLTTDSGANAGAASEFNILQDGTNGRIYFTNVSAFDAQAAFVFNETGADVDQRMEGDTDANLFTLDGGNDNITIGGTSASGHKLAVDGVFKVRDSGDATFTLLSNAAGTETVFNEQGVDSDTRIEGDTDANLFVADAGLDAIGMGGAAESGHKLKVTGNLKVTGKITSGGTSFPASPVSGDQYFRTDLGWLCYYDGTRWLTAHEFAYFFPYASGFTVDGDSGNGPRIRADYAAYITRVAISTNVATTNSGSAYWTVTLKAVFFGTGVTTVRTFNTSADTHDVWAEHDAAADTPNPSNAHSFTFYWAKTGTPGALAYSANIYYRLIVT